MTAEYRAQKLFATPLLLATLDEPGLNEALEKAILERRAAHPGITRSNVGGWHSEPDLLKWAGPAARTLTEHVLKLVNSNTTVAGKDQATLGWMIEGWANVNERGSANSRHVHGGSYWSAVYYVRVDEGKGGRLILHDPRMPTLAMHAPVLRFHNAGGERELHVRPRAGSLVVFPSWLAHEVEPWDGDGLRISIAINLVSTMTAASKAALMTRDAAAKAGAPQPPKEQQ